MSWNRSDAEDVYDVQNWANGYFSVNDRGHLAVHPRQRPKESIDLEDLVDQIQQRGIELPLLLRFSDILAHRVQELTAAFHNAIGEFEYEGNYLAVYPVKTNQQRHVVEELIDIGKPLRFGLECGSKPELLAVLALTHRSDMVVICNGFKDDDFLEMVLFAQKMGRRIIPVVEKFSDLELILRYSEDLGIRPRFGIRAKLSTQGSGRWRQSGGERSKFGLTVTELLASLRLLGEHEMLDGFRLLHFHLGSQVTNILSLKNAITEAARIYVELKPSCPELEYFDVGGGLGVDYDGSQTDFESSINYTLQEYARDVVARVQSVCDEGDVEHPTIVTESGRAIVAYHSVLVFNVLGVSTGPGHRPVPATLPPGCPQLLQDLHAIESEIDADNLLESYHDALQYYEEVLNAFKLGFVTLEHRSLAERLHSRILREVLSIVKTLEYVPEDLENLQDRLADTYFCNFSVFQSLPDSWAIQQLFPVLPIHRLNEEPSCHGVLADITCDSDGKIDRFINRRDVDRSLRLHPFDGREYHLGVFLVGAYQEILGDLHNLFGDTNAVHISLGERGDVDIDTVVKGDTVQEVLAYVQYSPEELLAQVRKDVETALRRGRITLGESARFLRFYESSLGAYTYLVSRHSAGAAPEAREVIAEAEKAMRRAAWQHGWEAAAASETAAPSETTGPSQTGAPSDVSGSSRAPPPRAPTTPVIPEP